jgi:hypothetical protein
MTEKELKDIGIKSEFDLFKPYKMPDRTYFATSEDFRQLTDPDQSLYCWFSNTIITYRYISSLNY